MSDCLCPLKQAALDAPDHLGFISKEETLTFHQLDRQTNAITKQLYDSGIKPGSVITSRDPTNSYLICLFFAVWRLGASICPLNIRLPPSQIHAHQNRLSRSVTHLIQSLFLFTSGSTATPKIAVLSIENLIVNALSAIETFDLKPNDRWLLSLPLYHVGGIGVMIRSILARATIVTDEKNSGITHVSYVPTQLYRATPIYKKLRCLLLGGAPIHHFPRALPCFISYGLTEMGSVVAAGYKQNPMLLLKNRELKISENKEIYVRGASLFQGYWKEETLEKPFDQEGWFKTGDLGSYCVKKGLKLIGRKDWQFISGGENIQPEEIENEVMQIEGVLEAVVVPISNPEFGQIPALFIKANFPMQIEHIQKKLQDKLPKYKIPKKLVIVNEMPKVGSKIDRQKCMEFFRN